MATYLDENGNPIKSAGEKSYLDDLGNPVPGLTPGSGNSGAAGRFASNFASAVNPLPGVAAIIGDPQGLRHGVEENVFRPQVAQFTKAGDAAMGRGEFSTMNPLERASSALGHGVAGALPLVGPAAANAGEQIGSGDFAGGFGSTAGLLSTAATPALMGRAGRGLSRAAEPVAENALGIRNVDRKFGRNPGRAVLDETSGVRPETVARQANDVVSDLSSQRDAALANSPNTVSLRPARTAIGTRITGAKAGNSLVPDLQKVQEHLTIPHEGFAGATAYPQGAQTPITISPAQLPSGGVNPFAPPTVARGASPVPEIAETQTPLNALSIRQRLGKDFTKFDMARPVSREQMAVGNEAYGNITDAIHQAVPASAPLDKRISNLIPVKESAQVKEIAPSTTGQVLARMGAKTGALAAGVATGAHYGNPVAGAIMGAVLPELLSNPTAQMVAARSLDAGGKALRSPIVGRGAQGAQLVRPARKSQ